MRPKQIDYFIQCHIDRRHMKRTATDTEIISNHIFMRLQSFIILELDFIQVTLGSLMNEN